MVLSRKGVLTLGCTHIHTQQFCHSVNLQLYLSTQFGVVLALDQCSCVRYFSGSLVCRDSHKTHPTLQKGSDYMATMLGRSGFLIGEL